ncbi:peptidylprolyl isomerase [Brevundimonas lenta]|nr:peptidyl-prolyl cis-trans isomerase [Brevundimonas lenta]
MLSAFRTFAKSKWAIGLLVVLGIALLVGGGTQMDLLGNLGPKHVISAGDRSVDQPEFRAEMDRIRDQAQQQAGRAVDFETLIGGGQLTQFLRQRAQLLGFMDWAWKAGIRPGKELILRRIREEPAFFDSVTGAFSEEQYRARLAENNLTPEMFEAQQRDEVMTRHYGAAIGAGTRLPRIYGAVLANQVLETRDGRWFTVTQAMAGTAPAPTDAQLTTFMNDNAARLRQPEFRSASLVVFENPSDSTGAVSEERIQERFNFRRDALSQPERRSFVTLTARDRASADRIAAALRAGQTPAAVAQANNIQPTEFEDRPRSAVTDPAIAAAVFALPVNEVSAPIQARVGYVVAKVSAIAPGRPAELSDVRAQVIQELRQEDGRAAVYARVEAYDKARQAGRTLDQAVAEVGARVINVPLVTREGQGREGRVAAPPQVLESMWKLGKGGESEVAEAGEGQYYVVRVNEVVPPALPSLTDPNVRSQLSQAWVQRENARLLRVRAQALQARLRRNEDLAAVAASVGATLQTGTGVSAQNQELGRGVIAGLFTTPRNESFSQQQTQDTFVIGKTDRITAPVPALAAGAAEQFRGRMAGDNLNALVETSIRSAADRTGATYDEAQARLALGLPATPPAAPASGAPGARPASAPAQ